MNVGGWGSGPHHPWVLRVVRASARHRRLTAFTAVFLILLAACYLGILTRMSHQLSSLWPANAVLAGVMLRWPRLNRPMGWFGAFLAFMTADLTTGGGLGVTTGLTVANMSGAFAMVAIAHYWPRRRLRLAEPQDVLALGGVCVAGAAAAAVVGVPVSMVAFGGAFGDEARSWFAGELALYLAILPTILTAPSLANLRHRQPRTWQQTFAHHSPVLALPLAVALGVWIGGPMALIIVLPLLLWSAVRGDVFQTALLGLLATGWNLIALGSNVTEVESFGTASELSVKVGLALLAAGPLTVAAAVTSREEALRQVHHLARHDTLTGLLNRRAFLDDADAVVRAAATAGTNATVFMIDLDHFKSVNDRFGHPTGDALLAAVGDALKRGLRHDAVIGRLGGEEFAVAIAGLTPDAAAALGERVRAVIAAATESTPATRASDVHPDTIIARELLAPLLTWPVSASIGIAFAAPGHPTTVSTLLSVADRQLYEAKRAGRDQVRVSPALAWPPAQR